MPQLFVMTTTVTFTLELSGCNVVNEYRLKHFVCNVCGHHKHGINEKIVIPRRYKKFNLGCRRCKTYTCLEFYDEKHKVWYYSAQDHHPDMDLNFYIVNVT